MIAEIQCVQQRIETEDKQGDPDNRPAPAFPLDEGGSEDRQHDGEARQPGRDNRSLRSYAYAVGKRRARLRKPAQK